MPVMDTRVQRIAEAIARTEIVTNFKMIEDIAKLPDIPVMHTGSFPMMSRYIDGFAPGELVIITGIFGSGKTLFAQTLTKDFCRSMDTPLWFTYEVPPRYFFKRFARNSIDLQFYLPSELVPYSMEFVDKVIRKAKEKFETNVVFIDHLHYVFDMSQSRNVSIDIGTIARGLKRLAVDLEITIFIICHTTKGKILSHDDMGLHLLRDSGLIACEGDTGIFLWSDVKSEGGIETRESVLKICKARRTGVMGKVIPIVKDGEYLREVD